MAQTNTSTPLPSSELSSPDPLNDSFSDRKSIASQSPSKRRASQPANTRQRRSSSHVNVAPSSPSKCRAACSVSPTKTVTEQTLSPWKIRVTVEAEPEGEDSKETMQTYTRTTTIPLRGESSPLQSIESSNTGRGRRTSSRTRASSGSRSKSRQRSATPKAGRRRRQSVTDLDIVVLGDDDEDDEWGKTSRKSSPRKSNGKKQTTSRRQSVDSKGISSLMDDFNIQADETEGQDDGHHSTETTTSPELREIDLNRVAVRPRANSSRQKGAEAFNANRPIVSVEKGASETSTSLHDARKVSVNSMRSYPTPSPTPSEPDQVIVTRQEDEPIDGFDTVMESEGFTMIDLDSIPSVRQLRSSPSSQEQAQENATVEVVKPDVHTMDVSPQKPALPTPGKPFPSYLYLAEGESDISSALPSSPPLPTSQLKRSAPQGSNRLQVPSSALRARHRQVTPQIYDSPKLPSPPRPTPPQNRDQPDSAKAMSAAVRLQGAMGSKSVDPVTSQSLNTPRVQAVKQGDTNDAIFQGFDSGTQRELRAGLRFGEELANRPKSSPFMQGSLLPETLQPVQPQVWRTQIVQQQAPLSHQALKEGGTQFSNTIRKLSTVDQKTGSLPLPQQSTLDQDKQQRGRDTASFAREGQWQRERDEVVRQAQRADSANVIVLDSHQSMDDVPENNYPSIHDITMEDADDDDIWLAEAKDSSSSPREAQYPELFTRTEQRRQRECAKEAVERPRRTKIPSPWKRGEQMSHEDDNTTVLTTGEGESSMSGLFWKTPRERDHDVRFGAGQIKETRRELRQSGVSMFDGQNASGSFNIEKMLGTPKRIRESLDNEDGELPGTVQAVSTPTEEEAEEEEEEEEGIDDVESSAQVDESSITVPPQTVPVKFNDSTLSQAETSPYKSRRSLSPSAQRPPTPRSAIKGSRQSLGTESGPSSTDNSDAAARRVIWAKRSNHMDEDWLESSRSMISEDDSSSAQSRLSTHEPQSSESSLPDSLNESSASEVMSVHRNEEMNDEGAISHQWQPVSKSPVVSKPVTNLKARSVNKSNKVKIPSYLLPPSYPSDPKRSVSTSLATSGQFTNAHFRTLHIIYAKSSRPRFHAPQIEECRPEIRKLVTDKWQLHVDEERAGLGGFSFKVGEGEGRVLERFCREVEWDYLCTRQETSQLDVHALFSDTGIWGGAAHGTAQVSWKWSCTKLAEWLGRIVVGEVVRSEEFGGKDYQK